MRVLRLYETESQTAAAAFGHDQALLARASTGGGQAASLRLWRRPAPGLALGRFHRMDPGTGNGGGLERRLSGGRAVVVGPGVLGLSMVFPNLAWLGGEELAPQQVPNRALRPLLQALRALGVDAFYGGRDLVTADRRALAHVSFTRMPDGVWICEQHLAVSQNFSQLGRLTAELDPRGIAAIDGGAYDESVSLEELAGVGAEARLSALLAEQCHQEFDCEVVEGGPCEAIAAKAPGHGGGVGAFEAFQAERGPLCEGRVSAAAISMLGAVEVSAATSGGLIHDLRIDGDLIAPFYTLEAVGQELEGQALEKSVIEGCLLRVLERPENFILGADQIAAVIGRLAPAP